MTLFCIFFGSLPLIPLGGLGFLVYGACLLVSGAVSRKEVDMLLRAMTTMLQGRAVRAVYK
jgi:hypothetical protein